MNKQVIQVFIFDFYSSNVSNNVCAGKERQGTGVNKRAAGAFLSEEPRAKKSLNFPSSELFSRGGAASSSPKSPSMFPDNEDDSTSRNSESRNQISVLTFSVVLNLIIKLIVLIFS